MVETDIYIDEKVYQIDRRREGERGGTIKNRGGWEEEKVGREREREGEREREREREREAYTNGEFFFDKP